MKRALLLAALVAVAVGSCLPAPNVDSSAPRLPKEGTRPDPGAPLPAGTPLATATVGPPPGPDQLIPRSFPAPFSYGPRYAPPTPIPTPVQPQQMPANAINILLLGSDRRSGRSFRTDTILILSVHPTARAAALISIPRDLYVYLPGFNMQRINAALTLGNEFGYPGGGRAMLSDAILYNLGIQTHYYAQVEMDGFRAIVDRLDGIDVHVACSYTDWRLESPELDPQREENWELFTVPVGVVHMDGDYALWYARSRAHSSDFDRARRQQEVLRALHRQALRLDLIPQIPKLYNEMIQSVNTDVGLAEALQLAPLAARIDPSRIRSRFIGRDQVNSWRTPTGGQVVLPRPDRVQALIREALDFEESDSLLPDNPILVEVQNGSSQPDWPTLAAERLTYAGFQTRVLRSAATPRERSRLIDYGLAPAGTRTEVLSALGLPASALQSDEPGGSAAAFRLIVGERFDPCFNPTQTQ